MENYRAQDTVFVQRANGNIAKHRAKTMKKKLQKAESKSETQ